VFRLLVSIHRSGWALNDRLDDLRAGVYFDEAKLRHLADSFAGRGLVDTAAQRPRPFFRVAKVVHRALAQPKAGSVKLSVADMRPWPRGNGRSFTPFWPESY
jgi:hypothetical protein